ncbi:MAG: beta-ketoacyl-ACP synthase III [Alphaproteobacteria bacterium]|nr:MAG: beta-ketoacyl-ACP synthase III [Alphaproteobacteria bacterium]
MSVVAISSTGLFTPAYSISNKELVTSLNRYVAKFNDEHADEIASGTLDPLLPSSEEFVEKASGIKSRYVIEKERTLDPDVMAPHIPERSNEQISILAEIALKAAQDALQAANKQAVDIDGVLVACSNLQRPYPAIAIEVQDALGIDGFGFDMNVACSSATFAIQAAADMIRAKNARAMLIINPEICSGHLNWRDRDSHFIFGDVATAILLEHEDACTSKNAYQILGTKLKTVFSNNIRNNFGFLNRAAPEGIGKDDKLFIQQGRKVFKEVVPMVSDFVLQHLDELKIESGNLKRLWLHQANIHMNELIGRKILGKEPEPGMAPVILDEYANTSSAGSIIAFHKYKDDLEPGDIGLICSFGAGYSVGSIIVKKLN